MPTKHVTIVTCDRCGAQSTHASPEEASKHTMQLRVAGMKVAYAPRHEDAGECEYLCPECAHDFRDWWRERSLKEAEA